MKAGVSTDCHCRDDCRPQRSEGEKREARKTRADNEQLCSSGIGVESHTQTLTLTLTHAQPLQQHRAFVIFVTLSSEPCSGKTLLCLRWDLVAP